MLLGILCLLGPAISQQGFEGLLEPGVLAQSTWRSPTCPGTESSRDDRQNMEKENRFSANKRMHPDFYTQSDFLYEAPDIVLLVAGRRLCNSQ
jgi:hypothetical protein